MVTRKEIKGIFTGKEIVARRKQSDFKKVQRIIVRKQNRYNPNRTGKEIHGYRKGNYRFQRKPSSHFRDLSHFEGNSIIADQQNRNIILIAQPCFLVLNIKGTLNHCYAREIVRSPRRVKVHNHTSRLYAVFKLLMKLAVSYLS
jgi:hypothetical protein